VGEAAATDAAPNASNSSSGQAQIVAQQIEGKVHLIAGAPTSPDLPMNKQGDISRLASCLIAIVDSIPHLRRPDGLNEAKSL
jgi:hypothetical protein